MTTVTVNIVSKNKAFDTRISNAINESMSLKERITANLYGISITKNTVNTNPLTICLSITHKNKVNEKETIRDQFVMKTRKELAKHGVYPESYDVEVKVE